MAKNDNLTDFLTDVANAIRTKKGTTDPINPQNFSDEIASIKSGGSSVVTEKNVNFVDYDGTLLYSYTIEEAQALTELPPLPIHPEQDIFVCEKWSKTLSIVNEVKGYIVVSALYKPIDTSIYKYLSLVTLDVFKNQKVSFTIRKYNDTADNIVIDWGDGSISTVTSTSYTTPITHIYANEGKYTMAILATTGSAIVLSQNQTYSFAVDDITKNSLIAVSATSCNVYAYAFYGCSRLKYAYVSFNSKTNVFGKCSQLKYVEYDVGSTGFFESCGSLQKLNISYFPSSNVSIFDEAFGLTLLEFRGSSGTVYSIPPRLKTLILNCTKIPKHSVTIPCATYGTKIFITDSLFESLKATTGWANYSNNIYPLSSLTEYDLS